MLHVAAAACSVQAAGGLHPVRRGFFDVQELGLRPCAVLLRDAADDRLAGDAPFDEDAFSPDPGKAGPACDNSLDSSFDWFVSHASSIAKCADLYHAPTSRSIDMFLTIFYTLYRRY